MLKAPRSLFLEAAKVTSIFVVFCLLQSQILEIRQDIHGQAIAHAASGDSGELDDTRRFVRFAVEDSFIELSEATGALQESVSRLEAERRQLIRAIEDRSHEVASDLLARLDTEGRKLETLADVARANAGRIESLRGAFDKDTARMKESMIFPTLQLRGNGTVGSGVLVYSELQPGTSEEVYTTFALTASHVIQEVLGEEMEVGKEVPQLHVVEDQENLEVYAAKLVLFDTLKDVALLRVNATQRFAYLADPAPLAALEGLDVFSPAYAVGCPLGNEPMPTLGEISSKNKVVGDQTFWMLNAPTFFGNSGGGVYQLPDFRLIGVSSMIYTYGKRNPAVVPHMGLFVPLATIRAWLEDEGYEFVLARRPVPPRLRTDLVFVEDAAEELEETGKELSSSSPGGESAVETVKEQASGPAR